MESNHILEMLSTNREYLRRKSNTALENLSMLHSSFDELADEGCVISLALNDAIAAMVFRGDYAAAIQISQRIIDTYSHSPYVYLIASHEMLIGRCLALTMQYEQAWGHLMIAETMAFDALADSEETRALRADVLHEIGMTTILSGGDRDEAVRCFEKALRLLGHVGSHRRRAVCIIAIGNVRFGQMRLEDAQNYYMRAESLLEDTDDYYNLSTVLCNLGVCLMCMSAYDISESYILRSLEVRIKSGTYGEIAGSYYNLACLYERKQETARAYKTMLTCRDYAVLSQARELQIKVTRELESLSLACGDTAAAAAHRSQLALLEEAV